MPFKDIDAKRTYFREYRRQRRAAKRKESDMVRMNWERAKSRVDGFRSAREEQQAFNDVRHPDTPIARDPRLDSSRFGKVTPTPEGYVTLLDVAELRGYAKGWAAHRFKERFGKWPRFDEDGKLRG